MTETAKVADIVLPATMFIEHDDFYQGGGSQYIMLGPKLVERARRMPQQSRRDLRARQAARRVASRLRHDAARVDRLDAADFRLGQARKLEAQKWIDCQPPFERAHYLDGFNWPDKKFRFKPDWPNVPFRSPYRQRPGRRDAGTAGSLDVDRRGGCAASVPACDLAGAQLPQFDLQRNADLARAEGRPTVMIHPEDAASFGIGDGDRSCSRNARGEVRLHARLFEGVRRGVADRGIDLAERGL